MGVILYAIRFVWVVSHILVLIKGDVVHAGYRWWACYVGLSLMMAVAYWPELLPGWEAEFAPFLVGVLLLRTLACLEALHVQTREFPYWSRLMGNAFLMGFGVILLLAGVHDNRWAGLLVEYRRYLQIWTMVVMFVVQLSLIDRGWWRFRVRDWHAAALFLIATNHGLVSWWCMAKHPAAGTWLDLNALSIAVDSVGYLAWTTLLDYAPRGRSRPRPLSVTRKAAV